MTMTNNEVCFYNDIYQLGLNDSQLSVVSSLFEACFPHPEAEWLFIFNDFVNGCNAEIRFDAVYTYRALSEMLPPYKIAMGIKSGDIIRLDDADSIKQFILDNKNAFYTEYTMNLNGVDIESIDDFDVRIDENGDELKPYIKVISKVNGDSFGRELFAVTLKTGRLPERIKAFNRRYATQVA